MTEIIEPTENLAQQILEEAERYEDNHPHKPLAYALGHLVEANTPASSTISSLFKERTSLTPDHLTPLVYATCQYIAVRTGSSPNFGLMSETEWAKYILDLFQRNDPEVMRCLRERNVQSFIIRRYFPAKLFARIVFQDKPISVLDVGCSLNLGLQAISADRQGELFPGINVDEIPKDTGKVNIDYGLGIDLYEPDIDWVASCIWPDHENERDRIREAYNDLAGRNPAIQFKKMNALELKQQLELAGRFDFIVASGMLYQLSPAEEKEFLQGVAIVSKPNAWLLISDYPRKTSYKTPFSYITSAYQISDGKIGDPIEFVKADDEFTTILKQGKDFSSFIPKFSST
jgi:hypothetical protein